MKLRILTIVILLTSYFSFAQEIINENITLENQFDNIYRTSTSYQTYKVISKNRFQKLKLDVIDSLKASKNTIIDKEKLLIAERAKVENIKATLTKTQQELNVATKKENTISFLGTELNKGTYNIILWLLIIILLLVMLYFMYKFSNSNVITKNAQNNLFETEQEFEQHRKKALEREQKLRRQLQDEINKQKNI